MAPQVPAKAQWRVSSPSRWDLTFWIPARFIAALRWHVLRANISLSDQAAVLQVAERTNDSA